MEKIKVPTLIIITAAARINTQKRALMKISGPFSSIVFRFAPSGLLDHKIGVAEQEIGFPQSVNIFTAQKTKDSPFLCIMPPKFSRVDKPNSIADRKLSPWGRKSSWAVEALDQYRSMLIWAVHVPVEQKDGNFCLFEYSHWWNFSFCFFGRFSLGEFLIVQSRLCDDDWHFFMFISLFHTLSFRRCIWKEKFLKKKLFFSFPSSSSICRHIEQECNRKRDRMRTLPDFHGLTSRLDIRLNDAMRESN